MPDNVDSYEAARLADADDIDGLVRIANAHAHDIAGSRGADLLLRRELAFTSEELTQRLSDAIGAADQLLVVGTFDHVVFGYGLLRYETLVDGSVVARLEQFLVEREARGVGIGEVMMNLLVDEATERGSIGIDSLALPGDRATKNFFESFGLKARQLVVHLAFADPDRAANHDPGNT